MEKNDYSFETQIDKIKTIQLKSECTNLQDALITTLAEVKLTNKGKSAHNKVVIRIRAFDASDKLIKQKNIIFEREIGPGTSISKPITLPPKTAKCKSEVIKSIQE